MARPPRLDLPGIAQHVVQRGNDRQACFFARDDNLRYIREFGDAARRFDCALYACFNRRYLRTGTLWEGRFKAGLVVSERYVLTCYRYIEVNAVRAVMVPAPGRYRWSSFRCKALGEPDDILNEPGPLIPLILLTFV